MEKSNLFPILLRLARMAFRLILIHDQEVGKKTHTGLKSNANMLDVIRDTGIWDEIREMPPLPGTNDSEAMNKYASMLFKLNAWRLDDCKRVLWMGTDSIVVRNIDELFTPPSAAAAFPHTLSVPDMGYWSMFWLSPAFNGDFIVFHPSPEAFRSLNSLAKQSSVEELVRLHKPPGPMDQGVLNKFYGADIHLLPWFYSIEAIGIVNIFRRNAKERAFGDTLAEHLLLDNDDSLPQTKLLGRDIPSVEWRWGDDRPFQGEDWLGPNQIRALMMLKNMKRWKTIHYAHHAMKPWRKDRGDYHISPGMSTLKLPTFFFHIWDEVCVDLVTNHPKIRESFDLLGDSVCRTTTNSTETGTSKE
mmetsp:Transcript_37917/g.63655  ORF Transcript_37917/g.63655 Transcript_37917/m.63655 type:complete len:359 (+) Transcript_37917:26-1102(+)